MLLTAASQRVREKLEQRQRLSQVALEFSFAEPDKEKRRISEELAAVLGVDLGYLRPDDRLRDILHVQQTELPTRFQSLFPKLGLTDFVNPFGIELLDFVERRLKKKQWKLNQPPFTPIPTNEGEWIDRIVGLTVGDLVAALT